MQNARNQELPDRSDDGGGNVRKAFVFYVNWFEDTADALSREEQGDFFRAIVRYASRGELPGAEVSPVVKSMFKLICPAIDSNFEKFDKKVEANKKGAVKSAEKRASQSKKAKKEKMVENEPFQAPEHIIENRELGMENGEWLFEEEERTKETPKRNFDDGNANGQSAPCAAEPRCDGAAEAAVPVAASEGESVAAPIPSSEEVEAYWRERHLKSDWQKFFSYYERMEWRSVKGVRLRSWKSAAIFWEEKFRKDVLPAIRRKAEAEAQEIASLSAKSQNAEKARFRAEAREAFMAEADERAAKAVSPEMSKYMYNRAMQLCGGDADRAIDLLKRADDDPPLFARLCQGYAAA